MLSFSSFPVNNFLEWRNAIERNKNQISENVSRLIQNFFRIYKTMKIYRPENPILQGQCAEFISILNSFDSLNSVSAAVRKTGLWFYNTKIEIEDEDFKPFLKLLVISGIKEIFFVKGIDKEEIFSFFNTVQRYIAHADPDSDFISALWDKNVNHIICITDMESGKSEKFQEFDFEKKEIKKGVVTPLSKEKMAELIDEFNFPEESSFENIRLSFENYTEQSVIFSYFERLKMLLLSGKKHDFIEELIENIGFLPTKLLNVSSVKYGASFLKSLITLEQSLIKQNCLYTSKLSEIIGNITTDDFIDRLFVQSKKITPDSYKSFSEMALILSHYNFKKVFENLNAIEEKELRITAIKTIAAEMKDIKVVKELLESSDWKIVRNVLFMIELSGNRDFVPLVKKLLDSEIEQIKNEAMAVLAVFSDEEVLPLLEKAVLSGEKDAKITALEKLVSLGTVKSRAVLDRIFRPANLHNFKIDEIDEFIKIVVSSGKKELFVLVGNLIFYGEKELRLRAVRYMKRIPETAAFGKYIAKKILSEDFPKMDLDELSEFVKLITPDVLEEVLEPLEKIWSLRGGFFNRNKYFEFKKIIISRLIEMKNNILVVRWIAKALKSGDDETVSIINSFQRREQ